MLSNSLCNLIAKSGYVLSRVAASIAILPLAAIAAMTWFAPVFLKDELSPDNIKLLCKQASDDGNSIGCQGGYVEKDFERTGNYFRPVIHLCIQKTKDGKDKITGSDVAPILVKYANAKQRYLLNGAIYSWAPESTAECLRSAGGK